MHAYTYTLLRCTCFPIEKERWRNSACPQDRIYMHIMHYLDSTFEDVLDLQFFQFIRLNLLRCCCCCYYFKSNTQNKVTTCTNMICRRDNFCLQSLNLSWIHDLPHAFINYRVIFIKIKHSIDRKRLNFNLTSLISLKSGPI